MGFGGKGGPRGTIGEIVRLFASDRSSVILSFFVNDKAVPTIYRGVNIQCVKVRRVSCVGSVTIGEVYSMVTNTSGGKVAGTIN